MSLISYVEPASMGDLFVGLGSLIGVIFFCWLFYKMLIPVIRLLENLYDKETKYGIIEEVQLKKIAEKYGIDLDKEWMSRSLTEKMFKKKSVRRELEKQVYESLFGKLKEKKGGE